jgi:hypothetical protein
VSRVDGFDAVEQDAGVRALDDQVGLQTAGMPERARQPIALRLGVFEQQGLAQGRGCLRFVRMIERLEQEAPLDPVARAEIHMASAPGKGLDQGKDLVMGQGMRSHDEPSPAKGVLR